LVDSARITEHRTCRFQPGLYLAAQVFDAHEAGFALSEVIQPATWLQTGTDKSALKKNAAAAN